MTIRPLGSTRPADPAIHLLTGARALDALDADEARIFDDHLDTCPSCAEEYAGLLATAAVLGSAEASSAPRALRRRILLEVSHTRQLRPLLEGGAEPRPVWRRPVAWLAAAAAAAVIATGVTLALPDSPGTNYATVQECVAAAPDVVSAAPSIGSGGDVKYSRSCDGVVVHLPAMGTVPAGQSFQIWKIDAQGPHSVGLAKTGADGAVDASMVTFALSDSVQSVAVTREPAGGSDTPSEKPFWQADLR